MSNKLTKRLNAILPRITSDGFLSGSGIGAEIGFYIFDYPPEHEMEIRKHIEFLLEQIRKKRPSCRVAHIDLFTFLLEYLEERNLLQKSIRLQRDKGNQKLLSALKGVLDEEKVAKRFATVAKPEEHDLVLVSGVGSVYPLLRSHTLLTNLHAIMGKTPLVMFYPGTYDQKTLRLFGKSGLATANYYRAFRLID